jgi:hypothetical protein
LAAQRGKLAMSWLVADLRFTDGGSEVKVYNPCIGFGTGDPSEANLQVPKPPRSMSVHPICGVHIVWLEPHRDGLNNGIGRS